MLFGARSYTLPATIHDTNSREGQLLSDLPTILTPKFSRSSTFQQQVHYQLLVGEFLQDFLVLRFSMRIMLLDMPTCRLAAFM